MKNVRKLFLALVWVSSVLGMLQRLSPTCPVPPCVERGTVPLPSPSPGRPSGVTCYWWGNTALGGTARGGICPEKDF